MERAGVPTAGARLYESPKDAMIRLQHGGDLPIVIKVDGLAAGKGVSIHHDLESAEKRIDEIFVDKIFGEAGNRILIEEFLEGEEASILAICNGEKFVTLLPAQDHKAVGEGDTGPNTGGMGSYCPAPLITADLRAEIEESVFKPVLEQLRKDGTPFTGCLYAGLMITADGPKVLEFNARFGDPETQCVLPLMKSDLVDLLLAASEDGDPTSVPLEWLSAVDVGGKGDGPAHAMCVVAASGGYPGKYEKGKAISGLDAVAEHDHVEIFHAGVALDAEGRPVTSGGRVLGVTGLGDSLQQARDRAYAALSDIAFEGAFHRRDIGHRAGIKWK
jgi:phosphoribosylamine--glycine ligase